MCVFLKVIVLNGLRLLGARWPMYVACYLAVPHRNNGHCYAVRTCEWSRSTPRQFIVPHYLELSVACRQLSHKMCIIDWNIFNLHNGTSDCLTLSCVTVYEFRR